MGFTLDYLDTLDSLIIFDYGVLIGVIIEIVALAEIVYAIFLALNVTYSEYFVLVNMKNISAGKYFFMKQ